MTSDIDVAVRHAEQRQEKVYEDIEIAIIDGETLIEQTPIHHAQEIIETFTDPSQDENYVLKSEYWAEEVIPANAIIEVLTHEDFLDMLPDLRKEYRNWRYSRRR
jgi:hypothetical protein